MKSFTSIVGWLLLAALIAVPSVLFYNWWAGNRMPEAKAQPQSLPSASLFAAADKSGAAPAQPQARQWNPAPSASAPPPAAPGREAAAPAAAAQPPSAPPGADLDPARGGKPAPVREPAPKPAQAAAPGPAASVAVSTQARLASYFAPKTDRDPTMSPDDYQKIRDAEEKRRDEELRQREEEARRQRNSGPASKISLQGIVGNQAIVNGEMFGVGQTVKGAKIIKIGSDYIIGEYKEKGVVKRFTKRMQ